MMNKLLACICIAALMFMIGTAGALELATIGLGQGILQMSGGMAAFALAGWRLTAK